MAFNDTLFQLGMDLTRSSPAHEEDVIVTVRSAHADGNSVVAGSDGVRKTGQRLVIDLVGAGQLASAKTVERALKSALEFAKGKFLKVDLKRAPRTGCISGTATFTHGHVSVEAWPATGYVAIDVVGGGIRPEIAMVAFADAFDAREAIIKKQRTASDAARWKKPVHGLEQTLMRLPQARQRVAKVASARAA